jgi:hypothetical protein
VAMLARWPKGGRARQPVWRERERDLIVDEGWQWLNNNVKGLINPMFCYHAFFLT